MDKAARDVITKAGYGEFFCHRTGHSIGEDLHGNGANMDNLETHETRRVLPRTCFSIEPGIYLPKGHREGHFGIRSEVNVFAHEDGKVYINGCLLQPGDDDKFRFADRDPLQQAVVAVLKDYPR